MACPGPGLPFFAFAFVFPKKRQPPAFSAFSPCALEERWYYCLACKKNIDDKHLSSDAHARYLEAWRQEQRIQQDPELEFIALVPLDEQNPESKRALRCLMCQTLGMVKGSYANSQVLG